MASRHVVVDYTNWQGKRAERLILPISGTMRLGSNEWHPELQWLFDAFDVAKDEDRVFALAGIHSWKPAR